MPGGNIEDTVIEVILNAVLFRVSQLIYEVPDWIFASRDMAPPSLQSFPVLLQ